MAGIPIFYTEQTGRMMSREKKITIFVVVAAVISAVLITASNREATVEEQEMAPASMVAEATPGLSLPVPPPPPEADLSGEIKKNSSFSDLMTASGATPQQIHDIVRESEKIYNLSNIRPGQKYDIFKSTDGDIEKIHLATPGETAFIEIDCSSDKIRVERIEYPYEINVKEASGIITQSFFRSLNEQELPQALGIMLTEIYAWDIDFFTEIRKNDFFRVIYEELRILDGPDHKGQTRIGDIIAAEFNTSGESRYCFLFENNNEYGEYFDYDGKSLQKQLLRVPLKFSRISSNFSKRRFHPVLHTYAPHLGIDYAAPTGTPVMSTGDGTVMTASRTRANGNYVKIRHNNNYISYYLHLSKFGKGIKSGAKVKQGQVIGKVGATGYATGPHLDYRVKKNGTFVNPRTLKLPPTKPVSGENIASFTAKRDSLVARMRVVPIRDPRGEYLAESGGLASEAPGRPGGSGGSPLPH